MGELRVLYEDNHIIAINKRCGDIIQRDKTGDKTLADEVRDYLKEKYNKPGAVFLGLPHRLDRPTSGVVLFARTSKSLERLNAMFGNDRTMHKLYWAVVDNKPPFESATLHHWLYRDAAKNKSIAYDQERKDTKRASLTYTCLASSDRYHLLEIELHTGRHHQIRAQLAAIGLHIKGDLKYGFPRSNTDAGIHLHARRISFEHPVGHHPVTIEAPCPVDPVWDYFEKSLKVSDRQES